MSHKEEKRAPEKTENTKPEEKTVHGKPQSTISQPYFEGGELKHKEIIVK
jgi:hypothetical protein